MAPPLPLLSSDKSPETTKPTSATNAVLAFRSRLISLRDWCVAEMETAANSNPLLKSILSVHANFHRFRQTQLRNPYSLSRSNRNCLSAHNFAAILPGDSVAGLVVSNGISNFLNLYNTLLVVRLVLTWFPGAPPAIVTPLSTICDPYLNIFRGLIPPLGGTLDLSPILAFLVLNAFTSTAAALPAELPTPSTSQEKLHPYEHFPLSSTTSQQKWTKRVCNQQNKNSRMSD